jgi:hypothetical protein
MLLRRMRCAAASILVFTAMHVVQVSEENAQTAESQPSVAVRLYVSAQAQAFRRFFAVNRNWHTIKDEHGKTAAWYSSHRGHCEGVPRYS